MAATQAHSTMERPSPVPAPVPRPVRDGITIIDPITRKGTGPGLIILVTDESKGLWIDDIGPSPMQKWGEEGYAVVEMTQLACERSDAIERALHALKHASKCDPQGVVGLVAYDVALWNSVATQVDKHTELVGAAVYAEESNLKSILAAKIPLLVHTAGHTDGKVAHPELQSIHKYPQQRSYLFASPGSPHFDYAAEAISHTRILTHLKKLMKGPYFNLEACWDEHTHWVFQARDAEATMNTMVQEPYINHIPTACGGVGRKAVTDFFTNHFIFCNPKDTILQLVSRTVGIDRVVDEYLFKCTHDTRMDWLYTGIPPTGKHVEIPFVSVTNLRGDRLHHVHITWDQASALRQIGWLPVSLPYPNPNVATNGADGTKTTSDDHASRLVLPVLGAETAAKILDKNAVPSNTLFTTAGVKQE